MERRPAVSFDGGDLDCGNGLLLLIRQHIDPLAPGELLEVRSTERSVGDDLPSWCRMTKNELVAQSRDGGAQRFLISKGPALSPTAPPPLAAERPVGARTQAPLPRAVTAVVHPETLPAPAPGKPIPVLAVMGIGSWPRPRWMRSALHDRLSGRMDARAFDDTADDAVRLAVAAQVRAGADVITDGEQRRDNYASFVGSSLDNCQLVPITDLLPYVDDPEAFRVELEALDVPADQIRHPAVFGPLGRSRPITGTELPFLASLTDRPVKIALPGPYLLTRTMWMECISDRAYADREALSVDIVKVLRQEIAALLAGGVSLIQLDEPVLSEIVYGRAPSQRSFMCGALGARRDPPEELAFAEELLQSVCDGFPRERLAVHLCRGNWTPDVRAALTGDYRPLVSLLGRLPVGTLLLEGCTPRAGDLSLLSELPEHLRVGVGMVDQKDPAVESLASVSARLERAIHLFGRERTLVHPDCGFATFADNPLSSATVAEQKLAVLVEAAQRARGSRG